MPYYERQPYIQPAYQLIQEVIQGEIGVPRFQRKGTEVTWRPEQRGDLLDSIYRGFPVGTILLWSTTKAFATYANVGRYTIPKPEGQRPLRLLLDGHQRVSTLVYILGPALEDPSYELDDPIDEQWAFDLSDPEDHDKPSRERFVRFATGETLPEDTLPLSIALDRIKLNEWLRDRPNLSRDAIKMADAVRDRLREYSIPIAVLATDNLSEAVESFRRINSSGTPMSDENMVAALVYSDHFDLLESIDSAISEHLEPIGWSDINTLDVLRIIAGQLRERGENNQHPLKMDIDALARALQSDGPRLVEDAVRSMSRTAKLLREVGVYGPKMLPYSYQLIIPSVYIGACNPASPHDLSKGLQRWFWLTTYGSVFRGASSSNYDRSLEGLKELVTGAEPATMARDISRRVTPNTKFDFRAARSKASVLAMARLQDEGDPEQPAHKAPAHAGTHALNLLTPSGRRSNWHHLAIIPPGVDLKQVRDALDRRADDTPDPDDDDLLRRVGVLPHWTGAVHDILEQRRRHIEDEERQLVKDLGLQWAN